MNRHAAPAGLPRLESEQVRVRLDPDFGARVVSLVDRRTGRDWMAPGGRSAATREDAVYGAGEAVGWDECFPTVAPCDARETVWGRRLRDHGDLWGRRWSVNASGEEVVMSFESAGYVFARALKLSEETLIAEYALTNTGEVELPFLWSQHALLAANPGDVISLPGVDRLDATYLFHDGAQRAAASLAWPEAASGRRLDRVPTADAGFAGKFYAPVVGEFRASVGNDAGRLEIAWSAADAPYLGLWLNYGAWPTPGATAPQIAIEPTTAPADHLMAALAGGHEHRLAPGRSRTWRVTMRLTGPTHSAPMQPREAGYDRIL